MTTDNSCLHCHEGDKVQVSCDACHAFICVDCHWCHEFQANHEIRVCDRCDSFLCKECEDMDQCHDCGEVVCKSCGSLLTCKFCGSALCEECATACAKCGIVLCGRDAKFAVDCDTCKLSYCLVCLASGQKETCIRCHARPSKRMEQLVHLRLKSIYKAFQQSARTNDAHPHLKRAALAAMKSNKEPKIDPVVAKAQADAAAAELLAELEEEESKQPKAKKKRKKKKKGKGGTEHHVQENKDDEDLDEQDDSWPTEKDLLMLLPGKQPSLRSHTKRETAERNHRTIEETNHHHIDDDEESGPSIIEIIDEEEVKEPEIVELPEEPEIKKVPEKTAEAEVVKESVTEKQEVPSPPKVDPNQTRLCELVNAEDVNGIEKLLEEWKGVPGKAVLRKNAKKALKRLKEGKPKLMLKIISTTPKSPTTRETVMEMDPAIVGFVIGKGGQKIRHLMDESGAKVWIDQESMAIHEPRVAYVSGAKKAVDIAVKKIQQLVKDAENPPPAVVEEEPVQDVPATYGNNSNNNNDGPPISLDEPLPPGWVREEITCEPRFVPLLIGRRGWNIKQIQDDSGAKVDIDQSVTPRIIFVTGTVESVQTAKRLISDVLSYPHAQLKSEAEDSEIFTTGDGRHSPPPSSYVMTGDIKSIISASSSLSSTPEPSMASSKGRDFVMPPPGLFDNSNRGSNLVQRYAQPLPGYNNNPEHFAPPPQQQQKAQQQQQPPNFPNMEMQHPPNVQQLNIQQQQQQQQANLRQSMTSPPVHHMGPGMTGNMPLHGGPPPPMMGQPPQPMQGMPPPHMQHHHPLNQPPMTGGGMHMNPGLMSQHQMAMQQQQMAMARQQQQRGGFMPHGNPNEAGMRGGGGFGGMGQLPHGPMGQQHPNSELGLFVGGANENRGSGLFRQAPPGHSPLPPTYPMHQHKDSGSNMEMNNTNGGGLLQPNLAGSMMSPASTRPTKDLLPGGVPMVSSNSQEESNLIDSLFAPATGGDESSLLAGLKGLNVGGESWEATSGIPGWGDSQEKSRLPAMQQQNESRFQWGS